ncbi:neutrophil cytosol factor 2 isoform X2 [Ambystoma mexicanum]|uniref:neutrophil cytosol factor 2 isoform X2 n=1 Tax=Ambystoma mexicanum TaxID=8296 RepID=UPI0037E787A5
MSLADTIRLWDEGVSAADKKDWTKALDAFSSVQDPQSKIFFNIGCIYQILQDRNLAEEAYSKSIGRDKHLAVAYFQRGSVFFRLGDYEQSLKDFTEAFTQLRGNLLIDYKILGLPYKLYGCEILHNAALAHAALGDWRKAEEILTLAASLKAEPRHSRIDKSLESILKQKMYNLMEMPLGRMFRPNEKQVAQLQKKDYLGKAEVVVVASVVDKDSYSGFAPLQPQALEPPPRPRTPEILRAFEGKPHRVLYEFTPATPEELQVVPGNIVFLLKKCEDNWATIMFNGKRGIVPCNYLEPLDLQFQPQSQIKETQEEKSPATLIPAPPNTAAPSIVIDKSSLSSKDQQNAGMVEKTKTEVPDGYIIKVHFKFTVNLQVQTQLPYEELLAAVSKKLDIPRDRTRLWYKPTEEVERVQLSKDNIESAWRQASNHCLRLWCELLEVQSPSSGSGGEKVVAVQAQTLPGDVQAEQVVALFSYEATQPEDLELQEGDIILVLCKVNEEWWEGQCRGKVGIFPTSFVEQYSKSQPGIRGLASSH